MGRGREMLTKLKIGSIILYTEKPIAFLMKPENAGDLWKVGLLVDYKTENICTILDSEGEYVSCRANMIIPYPDLPRL